ncbi:MAG: magnesium transporter [bacterium]|nr:MAG: magnesium transporter [bacterium]
MDEELEQKIAFIESAFEMEDLKALAGTVSGMRAPDVAEILAALQFDRRLVLFEVLPPELASETLPLLDEGTARAVLERIGESMIVRLVELMPSDDATDIINLLSPERAQQVLGGISWEEYEDVRELLKFDEETAGGLMAREIVTVTGETTINEVIMLLRTEVESVEQIQNIYVVDNKETLLGIIPLVNLLVVDHGSRAEEIMNTDVVTVTVDTDQEEVAAMFAKYDLYSMPVVDGSGRLVGRITVDDIIDVIEDEATEDITMMAGTGDEEVWERSPVKVSRARLPWLLTGLFGGIASAIVMNHFKHSLESVLALAFFVPVITAMGGNVGMQSSAIVVRELAVGGLSMVRTGVKLLRELKVSVINGIVLGSVLLVIVSLWQRDYRLGILLGLCMLTIIFWATLMGALVPLLLKRMDIDPALATGPFITTSNDILGILIYLGIATLFLDWIGGG